MMMQIINCEQGTEEWLLARMGIPTASEYKKLLGVRKDARDKLTRRDYMRKLAGEVVRGELDPSGYTNANFDRGKAMEPLARADYGLYNPTEEITQVGFIRSGNTGCSPDSLVGKNGMLEIKSAFPHIIVGFIEDNQFPSEHKPQCQGNLWIAEREWIDLLVYWPKMPVFLKRCYRDEAYIRQLSDAVDAFNAELAALVETVRRYGAI